ncbi:MAG: hypothetical protein AB8E15_05785 [Bdellovibrionales bacterium]
MNLKINFLMILVFLISADTLANKTQSEDICDHFIVNISNTGISKLAQPYLESKQPLIIDHIKKLDITDFSFGTHDIEGLPSILPDSRIFISRQSIPIFETTAPSLSENSNFEPAIVAKAEISDFEYKFCLSITNSITGVKYRNCDLAIKLKAERTIPLNLELNWNENGSIKHKNLLHSKASLRAVFSDFDLVIGNSRIGENVRLSDPIFEAFLKMAFKSTLIDHFSTDIVQMVENLISEKTQILINSLPTSLEKDFSIPLLDLRTIVARGIIENDGEAVLREIENLLGKISLSTRKQNENTKLVREAFNRAAAYLENFQHSSDIGHIDRATIFWKNLNQLFQKLPTDYRLNSKDFSQNYAAIESFYQKIQSKIEARSKNQELDILLSSFAISNDRDYVRIGARMKDIACTENDLVDNFRFNTASKPNDFSVQITTEGVNSWLRRSYDKKNLDMYLRTEVRCKSGICNRANQEVIFKRPIQFLWDEGLYKIIVPKAKLGKGLSTKLYSEVVPRLCNPENGNLCLAFRNLDADGRIPAILNLFTLWMVDINKIIEKRINNFIENLDKSGIKIIPNSELTYIESHQGSYIELFYNLTDKDFKH